jgi:hypothetical protein
MVIFSPLTLTLTLTCLSKSGGRPPRAPVAARRAFWSERSGITWPMRRRRSAARVESWAYPTLVVIDGSGVLGPQRRLVQPQVG